MSPIIVVSDFLQQGSPHPTKGSTPHNLVHLSFSPVEASP